MNSGYRDWVRLDSGALIVTLTYKDGLLNSVQRNGVEPGFMYFTETGFCIKGCK